MDSQSKNYQVIARKYRPQIFSEVVGQEAIIRTLKNALSSKRLAHAYLFCGCRGTGKTTLARVFAKALNCHCPSSDFEPCGTCSSCKEILSGKSLDVLEIDGASNRGIDDIRQINETIGYAPASGKYKIYIIDEVHMLTKEAFNALLKTLEEPPSHVKFFFATTEPHKVLPTIISRCQRFDLHRIPFEDLKKKLSWIAADLKMECEEDALSMIANLSEGSLRDAESLLDQILCYAEPPVTSAKVSSALGILPHSAFFNLDKAFEGYSLSYAFELANTIFSSGKDLSHFMENLIEHYRCILKLKLRIPMEFQAARLKEQYAAAAAIYTEEQSLHILDYLMQCEQQMGKTPFKRAVLETILLQILRSKHRIALPSLVKRLHELEQRLSSSQKTLSDSSALDTCSGTSERSEAQDLRNQGEKHLDARESTADCPLQPVYRNNPKNRDCGKETPQNCDSERATMAQGPGASENRNSEAKPTQPNPDSSGCFGISEEDRKPVELIKAINTSLQSRYDTLMRFAAVELEGVIKKEIFHG